MLDDIDLKILELLSENGRMSHEEISKHLNLTRPAIHRRIYKMEEAKLIKGYKVIIDWESIGYNVDTFVLARVNTSNFDKLIKEIKDIKDPSFKIFECFRVTGEHCIMLRIKTVATSDLRRFYDMVLELDGVLDTKTLLILKTEEFDNTIFYNKKEKWFLREPKGSFF